MPFTSARASRMPQARPSGQPRSDGSGLEVVYTLTRSQPSGWRGYGRRIDPAMLATVAGPLGRTPLCFICGPTLLVEAAANGLAEIGVPVSRIRTERFGPSGS